MADKVQYPVFEAAITGRAALEGSWDDFAEAQGMSRGKSMIDLSAQTEAELEAIRNAVVQKEGLLLSVFDVLRRVPRRVLMVLKLNDLTRGLDRALATTHANVSNIESCLPQAQPYAPPVVDSNLPDHRQILHIRSVAG